MPLGKVGLGSGEQATLDFSGDGFLQVAAPTNAKTSGALIESSGTIKADGGAVIISAATAREAARNALARVKTVEAARAALEEGDEHRGLPDLWPTAIEAGWSGLVVSEEHGGAGLGAFEAMLVAQECGRVLAGVPLLGHVVATYVLDAAGYEGLEALAAGERRAAVARQGAGRARRDEIAHVLRDTQPGHDIASCGLERRVVRADAAAALD